jgi:hypothetical protein
MISATWTRGTSRSSESLESEKTATDRGMGMGESKRLHAGGQKLRDLVGAVSTYGFEQHATLGIEE